MNIFDKLTKLLEHKLINNLIIIWKKIKPSKTYWTVAFPTVLFIFSNAKSWKIADAITSYSEKQINISVYPWFWELVNAISVEFYQTANWELVWLAVGVLFIITIAFSWENHSKKYNQAEAEFTINKIENFPGEYSLFSLHKGLWKVDGIYVELMKSEMKIYDKFGCCKIGACMQSQEGKYIVEINNKKKYYPLLPLSKNNNHDYLLFRNNDFEKISIIYLYPEDIKFTIRLIVDLYNIKENKKSTLVTKTSTLYTDSRSTCNDEYHFSAPILPILINKSLEFEPLICKLFTVEYFENFLSNINPEIFTNECKHNLIYILKNHHHYGYFKTNRALKIIIKLKDQDLYNFIPEYLFESDYEIASEDIENFLSNINPEIFTNERKHNLIYILKNHHHYGYLKTNRALKIIIKLKDQDLYNFIPEYLFESDYEIASKAMDSIIELKLIPLFSYIPIFWEKHYHHNHNFLYRLHHIKAILMDGSSEVIQLVWPAIKNYLIDIVKNNKQGMLTTNNRKTIVKEFIDDIDHKLISEEK